MALGFGYDSWIGFGDESTYGTGVSPTIFSEIMDESLSNSDNYIAKPSLRGVSHARKVQSKILASGSVKFQVGYTGLEKLFKHALGSSSVSGSSTYTHAISLADALPTGITLHVNRNASNIGTAYRYVGCQVGKLTLSQSVEDFLMASFDFTGRDEETISVASPTFPTFTGCQWSELAVSINSVTTHKVRSYELTLDNSLATDRHQLGSALVPGFGRSAQRKVTFKCQAEFDAQTVKNLHINKTKTPVVLTYTGSGVNVTTITVPALYVTKADTFANSPGVLMVDVEGEAYIDSAQNDELTISQVNTTAGPD